MKKSELNISIKNAGIAGIIALVLSIPSNTISLLLAFGTKSDIAINIIIIASLIITILNIIFLRGFVLIGTRIKNSFLVKASYIAAIATIISAIGGIASIIMQSSDNVLIGGALLWMHGISSIIFGISLLMSEKYLGNLAIAAGILEMIAGITYISIILYFGGILIAYPAMILEIMILFKASKEL